MMGLQSFEVIWQVEVKQPHTITAIRKAGVVRDIFEIVVDGQVLLSVKVGTFKLRGSQTITIDEEPILVQWRWGLLTGSPVSIVFMHNNSVLAEYPQGLGVTIDTTHIDSGNLAQLAAVQQGQVDLVQYKLLEAKAKTKKQIRSGASWFFWIAGLSMLNSLMAWFGGGGGFFVGLAITQILDGFIWTLGTELGMGGSLIFTIVALSIDLMVACVFVIFGFLAIRKYPWSFIIGMSVYGIDAVICVVFGDLLSFAFHVLALLGIYGGFRALKQLGKPGAVDAVTTIS